MFSLLNVREKSKGNHFRFQKSTLQYEVFFKIHIQVHVSLPIKTDLYRDITALMMAYE